MFISFENLYVYRIRCINYKKIENISCPALFHYTIAFLELAATPYLGFKHWQSSVVSVVHKFFLVKNSGLALCYYGWGLEYFHLLYGHLYTVILFIKLVSDPLYILQRNVLVYPLHMSICFLSTSCL